MLSCYAFLFDVSLPFFQQSFRRLRFTLTTLQPENFRPVFRLRLRLAIVIPPLEFTVKARGIQSQKNAQAENAKEPLPEN